MDIIHYISTNEIYKKRFEQYLKKQNPSFSLEEYDIDNCPIVDVLVIIEGIHIKSNNIGVRKICIANMWKIHLDKYTPETKLFIVGTRNINNPQYIDLLSLPLDFKKIIEKSNSNNSIPTHETDVFQYIEKFYDGHADKGLLKHLTYIAINLRAAKEQLDTGKSFEEVQALFLKPVQRKLTKEEEAKFLGTENQLSASSYDISEQVETFINRWNYYKAYFKLLPFKSVSLEIDEFVSNIEINLKDILEKESVFIDYQLDKKINEIKNRLAEIEEEYVSMAKINNVYNVLWGIKNKIESLINNNSGNLSIRHDFKSFQDFNTMMEELMNENSIDYYS